MRSTFSASIRRAKTTPFFRCGSRAGRRPNGSDTDCTSQTFSYWDDDYGNGHYAAIKDFDAFMRSLNPRAPDDSTVNDACSRSNKGERRMHLEQCSKFEPVHVTYPDPNKVSDYTLKFNQLHPTSVSHFIVADFECLQTRLGSLEPTQGSYTHHQARHEVCGFAAVLIGPDSRIMDEVLYRGTKSCGDVSRSISHVGSYRDSRQAWRMCPSIRTRSSLIPKTVCATFARNCSSA